MFTGIVDHQGKIKTVQLQPQGLHMGIQTKYLDVRAGESISVDGICLTALLPKSGYFEVDVCAETLNCTNACHYQPMQAVNLERAMRSDSRFEGHWVTGHIDTTSQVLFKQAIGGAIRLKFSMPSQHQGYLMAKGSIAINGVSLCLNQVGDSYFEILLIPHTVSTTNLGSLERGHRVNVELDWMQKVVFHYLEKKKDELFCKN